MTAEDHGAKITLGVEGERIWFNGALITIKVSSDDSGGAYVMFEGLGRGGHATPLHIDPTIETFRVLEGELLVHIAGSELRVRAGDTVLIPKGVPHALMITSPIARTLVVNAPGGHDRFFRAAGTPASAAELPPPSPPDFERMKTAAARLGMQILGPPPFTNPALA